MIPVAACRLWNSVSALRIYLVLTGPAIIAGPALFANAIFFVNKNPANGL